MGVSMENTKYLVWLTMVLGNTSANIWNILKNYDSASDAYYDIMSGVYKFKPAAGQLKKINEISLDKAKEIVDYCRENKVGIACYDSDEYPQRLKSMKYPPVVLYYRGDISCIAKGRNITCVGTRKPSEYTFRTTSSVCSELVKNGFTIVSGFAKGVDITSHLAAVTLNRPTVCVLGCGVDHNYPSENACYRKQILENGGVFISEYFPTQKQIKGSFQRRNIILAALSDATIVFEAAEKSGSLSTAESAVEQGKKLFCIPPSDIYDSRYAGNIEILRTTALPFYSADDIFKAYDVKNNIRINDCADVMKSVNTKNKSKKTEKLVAVPVSGQVPEKSFTPVQLKILDMLTNCTLHVDIIINKLDMDISDIIMELMELQFMGLIEEVAGSRFRRI